MNKLRHGRAISAVGLVGLLVALLGRSFGRTGRLTLDGIGLVIVLAGGVWFIVELRARRSDEDGDTDT